MNLGNKDTLLHELDNILTLLLPQLTPLEMATLLFAISQEYKKGDHHEG